MKKISALLPFFLIGLLYLVPSFVEAEDAMGQTRSFYIEESYDIDKRSQIDATVRKISPQLYFYIDESWWGKLSVQGQEKVKDAMNFLTEEFEGRIYPLLTQNFGKEWNPGIDKDTRITILLHPMKEGAGGYFNEGNEYPKSQVPESNEREIIFLNANVIDSSAAKGFLAHEFMHLITFYQKNMLLGTTEDVWLNEARSEYAPTYIGYDREYSGSNLERRVRDFSGQPFDSLTEWRNRPADYGAVNLFTQYLVDHYGAKILIDSLHSRKVGIASLNEALKNNGYADDFSQIFTNWTIAVLMADCGISQKYCYLNQNLKNLKITPLINYLPFVGESTLSVTNNVKDWSGNWHKFIGGKGTLNLEFRADKGINFKVPYLIQDAQGNYSADFLLLNQDNLANLSILNFGTKDISLIILPLAENKTSDFGELERSYAFFWSVSTIEEGFNRVKESVPEKPISQMTKGEILARISEIQALILKLQAELRALARETSVSCSQITDNLYYGLMNDQRVKCLQEFLKSQGPDIYPEGAATGNFLSLTRTAVTRFQEKYGEEILTPLGLEKGTGFVGYTTRAKINSFLAK
ncbi:MAG: hypothetical protein HYW70_03160 [Candidatus Nealsonbacteria bacterium]|nr:hypothetical protein [Candidatus Nealsonbacteria bacterium]